MNTLYVTTHEKAHYDALPEALKAAWGGSVAAEAGTAYETPEVVRVRMTMLPLDQYPAFKEVIDGFLLQAEGAEPFSDMSYLKRFPEELLPEFLFAIGGIGISALIESALQENIDEAGLENVAFLSLFRHKILEANGKYSVA